MPKPMHGPRVKPRPAARKTAQKQVSRGQEVHRHHPRQGYPLHSRTLKTGTNGTEEWNPRIHTDNPTPITTATINTPFQKVLETETLPVNSKHKHNKEQ